MAKTPLARELWHLLEPVNAVTYFADESRAAAEDVGFKGFWMGYFGFRAAPLGAVGPGPVEALFAGFATERVTRALPDAWAHAAPADALEARASSAAAALRRLSPDAEAAATAALPLLRRAIDAAPPAGRPLFAANRDLPERSDPVEALWQACTTLREHRGDAHVACLTAGGLDGPLALVLAAACEGLPAALLQRARGWSDEAWQAAAGALEEQGLVEGGAATPAGLAVRAGIEERTDALALAAYRPLGVEGIVALQVALRPIAAAVAASGTIPFPNPMVLPPPATPV